MNEALLSEASVYYYDPMSRLEVASRLSEVVRIVPSSGEGCTRGLLRRRELSRRLLKYPPSLYTDVMLLV